jgi:carbohydrate-selective porin OprB
MPSPRFHALALVGLLALTADVGAQDAPPSEAEPGDRQAPSPPPNRTAPWIRRTFLGDFVERDTLTDGWFGAGKDLEAKGITLALNFWILYQANVTGGRQQGDATTGEYRLTGDFDLQRLAGLGGAAVFLDVRGGWNDDLSSEIGTLLPVNGEFFIDAPIVVAQLWYEQRFLNDRLRFRIGKADLTEGFDFHGQTVAFDGNAYANFGGTQFLDGGLINNLSIGYPGFGFAALLFGEPVERIYAAGAIANADADTWGTGFEGMFGGDPDWFVAFETGFVPDLRGPRGPLPGQIDVGFWYSEYEGLPGGYGFYLGLNQLLYREGPDDLQGLGIFARYGWAHDNPAGIANLWSLGGQYRGLIPTRDSDVLGVGWVQSFTVDDPAFTAPYEGVLEAYYRLSVTPWFRLSPRVQYIVNPGSTDTPNALVLGLRGQFTF